MKSSLFVLQVQLLWRERMSEIRLECAEDLGNVSVFLVRRIQTDKLRCRESIKTIMTEATLSACDCILCGLALCEASKEAIKVAKRASITRLLLHQLLCYNSVGSFKEQASFLPGLAKLCLMVNDAAPLRRTELGFGEEEDLVRNLDSRDKHLLSKVIQQLDSASKP